jgi:hypothetical protein
MNTGLLQQLRIYGDDFDAGLPPVTLDELTAEGSGPPRVQPLSRYVDRPVSRWVAVAAAAAGVLVLLGGTAWLTQTTGSDTPVADTVVPNTLAATDIAAQGEGGAVSVTGNLLDSYYWHGPPYQGSVREGRMEMSDMRLSGDVTFIQYAEGDATFESVLPPSLALFWGTMLIENDGGTWEGTHFSADHHARADAHGPLVMQFTGSGNYEGLSAILYQTVISDPGETIEFSVDGMIFPGNLPPDRLPPALVSYSELDRP